MSINAWRCTKDWEQVWEPELCCPTAPLPHRAGGDHPCSWIFRTVWWFLLQRSTVATPMLVNVFFHICWWWKLYFDGTRRAFEFCLKRTWHMDLLAVQASALAIDAYLTHLNSSLSLLALQIKIIFFSLSLPLLQFLLAGLVPLFAHLTSSSGS